MGNISTTCICDFPAVRHLETFNNDVVGEEKVNADMPLDSGIEQDATIGAVEDNRRLSMIGSQGRRAGVAAECVSISSLKDYVKPFYSKDEATCQRLREITKLNEKLQVIFGHLDSDGIGDVVNAFQAVEFPRGKEIIRQGDEGDCLYIIDRGEVDVHVARPGRDGRVPSGELGPKVVTLGAGSLFGELALLYSAPRAASVIISSPNCKLLQLDREPLKMMLAQKSHTHYERYEGWLSEVDLLKSLNHYELSRLSDLLDSTLYDDGEVIIQQGDIGDKFFILEDGTCSAYMSGPEGEKKVKDYDKQGDYFGEIALLTSEPRKATVRATGQGATVLSLSQQDFTLILGPLQDVLKKDMTAYKEYEHYFK